MLVDVLDEVDAIRYQLSQDRDLLLISSFCQPRLYTSEAALSGERYNPPITWFKLSADASNMLVPLYDLRDSTVFREIWKMEVKRVASKGIKLTVDQIERSIWQPSKGIWESFCRGMVGICN